MRLDCSIPMELTLPENCHPKVFEEAGYAYFSQASVRLSFYPDDLLETLRQLHWLDSYHYKLLSCAMGRCLRGDEKVEPVGHVYMEEFLGMVWQNCYDGRS